MGHLKSIFKIGFCLLSCLMLMACGSGSTSLATAPSLTPTPSQTVPPTGTPSPTYAPGATLIPTVDPTQMPGLLKTLTIQPLASLGPFNKYPLRRITGWSRGFDNGLWGRDFDGENMGYQWMDIQHLLLFPAVGEREAAMGRVVSTLPLVLNIDTGNAWLPPYENLYPYPNERLPQWSPALGALVVQNTGEGSSSERGITVYTSGGNVIGRYSGSLYGLSPSGTKLLSTDHTWVDLANPRIVDFGWGAGMTVSATDQTLEKSILIWSPDELNVYQCCYYYGNAATGESYVLSDENTILDGHPIRPGEFIRHSDGVWLKGNYVLGRLNYFTSRPGFIQIFDISARTFHNLGVMAGLPDEFNDIQSTMISVSPNRDYIGLDLGYDHLKPSPDSQVYVVDVSTFRSRFYQAESIDWSTNGKYAVIGAQALTLSDNTAQLLPVRPDSEKFPYVIASAWHPTLGVRAEIGANDQDDQSLYLLDVESMKYQHLVLPSNFHGLGVYDERNNGQTKIIWNPTGDRFALVASDGSLWQMDYPKLENLEQLTPPMAEVKDVSWSPDGVYLSFVGGTDIYIVDTEINP